MSAMCREPPPVRKKFNADHTTRGLRHIHPRRCRIAAAHDTLRLLPASGALKPMPFRAPLGRPFPAAGGRVP